MRRFFLSILGILCIIVGIVGLFLPFIQGLALIFLGLSLLAPGFAKRLHRRILRKFSKKEIFPLNNWKKSGFQAGFTTKHFKVFMPKTEALMDSGVQQQFLTHFSPWPYKKFVVLNQVHSDGVAVLENRDDFRQEGFTRLPEMDAVITSVPGLTLLVFTADCLSIFYKAGGWCGLAHAGWRGTKLGIAQKTLMLISEKSGVPASKVQIILGPRIGQKHYEVGPEFKTIFPATTREAGGKFYFDLGAENKRQLLEMGALGKNLTDLEICTVSENEDFYSFRKEKEAAGRMVSFIAKSDFS